jgi:hypothetical protein
MRVCVLIRSCGQYLANVRHNTYYFKDVDCPSDKTPHDFAARICPNLKYNLALVGYVRNCFIYLMDFGDADVRDTMITKSTEWFSPNDAYISLTQETEMLVAYVETERLRPMRRVMIGRNEFCFL